MELFIVILLMSFFSVVILSQTMHSLIQAFTIALKRSEISKQKYTFLISVSGAVALLIITVLPFGYYKLFGTIM